MPRSRAAFPLRAAFASALLAAAWQLALPRAFCGSALPAEARGSLAQRNGWRLDMMEFGPKGIGQLVIHEGYFIGEQAMFDIMNKNGRRYRMRATKDEQAMGGADVEPITQIGPFKVRLFEIF